jgi:hypothetical protein
LVLLVPRVVSAHEIGQTVPPQTFGPPPVGRQVLEPM